MLSVKRISLAGIEEIYLATGVRFHPAEDNGTHGRPGFLIYQGTDGVERPLKGGTVFVMNDMGKTVARYDIGASVVPLDPDMPTPEPAVLGRSAVPGYHREDLTGPPTP